MIKKLRLKFIVLALLAVLIVLSMIIGTVNILSYREIVRDADGLLAILIDNDGKFPKMRNPKEHEERLMGEMSPETPYESRYFSVRMTTDGKILLTDTGRIAAVDEETAKNYAETVRKSLKEKGFVSDYRYMKKEVNGEITIICLDCQRSLSNFRAFLAISVLVSILGFCAVAVMIILLSGRIIRPVAESYEKQKRFITDAGHEIKTPLTIIDADVSVLELEQGESEWLRDIQVQTKRLAALTKELIFLSKLEEESSQLQMIDFPVSDVLEETLQSFQAIAKVQNKNFVSEIEPMMSLCADEQSIRRMFSILLDNAVKYSKANSEIFVSARKKGKNIKIQIYNTSDFAIPDNPNLLFERFYRAESSRNSSTGGYGIGLSVARAVVAAHKGKISAASKDGKSLSVTVVL